MAHSFILAMRLDQSATVKTKQSSTKLNRENKKLSHDFLHTVIHRVTILSLCRIYVHRLFGEIELESQKTETNMTVKSRRNPIKTSKNPFEESKRHHNEIRPPSSTATTVVLRRITSAHDTKDQKMKNLAKVNAKITVQKVRSKSDGDQDRRVKVHPLHELRRVKNERISQSRY